MRKRVAYGLIAALSLVAGYVLACLSGCATTRVPTAADQQAISSSLVEYEKSNGAEPFVASAIRPRIRVKGHRAWARYNESRPGKQMAGCPIEVELEKQGNGWVVVSEKSDWPWWWHLVNRTVGVK